MRRAASRARTVGPGRDVRHSFSAGWHYDPANTSHGRLLVCDEVQLAGGAGFTPHAHRGEEVLTWVLDGALAHEDSTGRSGVVRPGVLQRMSAGTGVRHSERNADPVPGGQAVHLVQMRLAADDDLAQPAYESADVDTVLAGGELVPVASGRGGGVLRLACRSAVLHAARLRPGRAVALPEAPFLHLLVVRGRLELEGGGTLAPGDAVRGTATGGQSLSTSSSAEVLVWEMHTDLR